MGTVTILPHELKPRRVDVLTTNSAAAFRDGAPPAALRSERVRALHAYWQAKRGDRALPARADIDPADIKPLLPFIIISDLFDDPVRVRYRLAGTVVTESFGFNIAGRWLHELDVAGGVPCWTALYRRVLAEKAPVFGETRAVIQGIEALHCEWGLMPLASDGAVVDKCIEIEDWRALRGPARFNDDHLVWTTEAFDWTPPA